MNDRLLFPNLGLFKKELVERFLVATREIFRIHPAYGFHDDESKTRIHIDPTYANIQYEGKNPRFLVRAGGYNFHLNDTFNNNAVEQAVNNVGAVGGFRSVKNLATSVSVTVRSFAEEEASDLADELSVLGVYGAKHMYAQVGVNILEGQVSETAETDNNNDLYETTVVFRVEVPWEFTKVSNEHPFDPQIEYDEDYSDLINGYRRPGVYVLKGRIVNDPE